MQEKQYFFLSFFFIFGVGFSCLVEVLKKEPQILPKQFLEVEKMMWERQF